MRPILLLLVLAAPLTAQSARWSLLHFGQDAVAIGDIDGDGWGDLATTRKGVSFGYAAPGSAAVVSGRDGRVRLLLDQLSTPAMKSNLPRAEACGDLDADGVADFAFDIEGGWHTFAAATLSPSFTTAGVPSALGDATGDGHDDLVVLASVTEVRLVSGADGQAFLTIPVPKELTDGDLPALEARAAGDMDGDGEVDVVVRGELTSPSGERLCHLRVYSGANGALIASDVDNAWFEFFTRSMLPAGDADADGHDDLFVLVTSGARLVSGADLGVLRQYSDPAFSSVLSMAAPGDVDRDGFVDVALGGRSPTIDGPVTVFSGADASVVASWAAGNEASDFQRINSLATPGDLDGDGCGDLVVGCVPVQIKTEDSGPLRPFSLATKPIADLGGNQHVYGPWPGVTVAPVLSATGSLQPDSKLVVRVVNGLPGPAWIFAGGRLEGTPWLEVVPDVVLPLAFGADGVVESTARWPTSASGLVLHLQMRWPDGVTRSNIVWLAAP